MAALTFAAAVAGAVMHAPAAAAESNGGVRVMPLGDSITEGHPGAGRLPDRPVAAAGGRGLSRRLRRLAVQRPVEPGRPRPRGAIPGWRIDQIDANITGWLRTYNPHTVLLHIGTNDILQNSNVSGAPGRLSTLIDHITAAAPSAEVFVATIIPLGNAGQESAARTFNAAIPGIVQSRANAGKHVHLVDMHAALTAADLTDGVHPTAAGYDKMAATWYTALRSVPGSLETSGGATGSALVGAASGRCLDVPGSNTTNGTQPIIWDCSGNANQQWTYTASRQLQALGKCLDAPTGAVAGAKAQIYSCSGQANQQWTLNADGTISSVSSGLCLDVYGAATANNTPVVLWTCTAAANQRWNR
ncbi:SGNH/GDSL hydrolase family protein [Dactylosporangium vinaceum]